ncbi:MAG TPA: hypothetical protein ACFYD4_14595 [Candidatus Wunengus sp. YC61]|uniref:hypothetical protein n=1 Tax=Candidatus Wunengus sp. YC61 TaxID=3367698 RepID=UPI0040258BF3
MTAPFTFESNVLAIAGLKSRVTIPAGFVMDGESVPIVRGRNVRGGAVHDYLSCFDSDPVCPTQSLAANVYLEINAYCDEIDAGRSYYSHAKDFLRRWAKWSVVYVWPGFFHKRSVKATCKDLYGFDGDKYMTVEKLAAAIVQSKEATAAIKEVPAEVTGQPAMVEASEQVTANLKEAKVDAVLTTHPSG